MNTDPRRPASIRSALACLALLGAPLVAPAAAARADMAADSPVKFPESGPLPAKFPPDESAKDYAVPERDYAIHSSPERSLGQIQKIQAEMPAGRFTPPPADWAHLPRTRKTLTEGGDLHVMAVGDSIVADTMRSGWVARLREAYPKARIRATVYVRGGGGCQHYKAEGRVQKHVIPRRPDLVLIGGISQRDTGSIREVVAQLRAGLPDVEVLLFTGTFGTGDYGRALKRLAAEERCAYLDMTTPWAQYVRSAGVHPHAFYRDAVHANEYGEQVLSKVMMAFFTAEP